MWIWPTFRALKKLMRLRNFVSTYSEEIIKIREQALDFNYFPRIY